eukprot:1179298-Prorocentrum_minimum.AAC.3
MANTPHYSVSTHVCLHHPAYVNQVSSPQPQRTARSSALTFAPNIHITAPNIHTIAPTIHTIAPTIHTTAPNIRAVTADSEWQQLKEAASALEAREGGGGECSAGDLVVQMGSTQCALLMEYMPGRALSDSPEAVATAAAAERTAFMLGHLFLVVRAPHPPEHK